MPALVVDGSGEEEAGLQAGEAAHAPLRVGDLTDEFEFERVGGLDVGFEGGELAVEVGGVLAGQDGIAGEESVFECVLRGYGIYLPPCVVRWIFLRYYGWLLICARVGMIIIPFVGAVEPV